MTESGYKPTLHRIALLTAAATFPLIFMGGLVTSHQAGMSVPDWPNSWGYNMFLFPPRLWVGGIFYEHTHRLMGTVVGMLAIILTIAAWRLESRRWVRWLATGVLGAVIFQGVLGGLRVVLVKLDLAIVHACFAQAFFCLAALVWIVTSKWWILDRDEGASPASAIGGQGVHATNSGTRLIAIAIACVIAIYAQLIVGATMRHYQAGLAIPDVPLAYGKLLPPIDANELRAVNIQRVWHMNGLYPVTLGQIWLAFGHRIGAVLVTAMTIWLASLIFRRHRKHGLTGLAVLLVALLVTQLALGVVTVLWRKPADVASAHVAVGALALVTTFVIAVRSIRLFAPRPAPRTAPSGFEAASRVNGLVAA
jgi:cytochrome c oxidase assembly protein subunit 15